MAQVLVVYEKDPGFPATDQHPSAVRYTVGGRLVDAIGGTPTQAEVDAVLKVDAAGLAEKARLQGIKDDAQRVALLNQLKTATAAQIDSYVDAQVTDLASARTMLKRIIKVLALLARE